MPTRLLTPAVWGFYLIVVLEFLFMISPAALYFYTSYGPLLNVLHNSSWTAWLTGFFLPHFSDTTSPALNALKPVGFLLAGVGLLLFLVGALQVYAAKLLRRGAVTGGLYRIVRHPQYLALAILGLGTTLIWPRFLVLLSYLTMLFLYWLLARWEEERCERKFGDSYREYQRRTGMILPRVRPGRTPGLTGHNPEIRGARVALLYAIVLLAGVSAAFALRAYSLSRVSLYYTEHVAVLSPAVISRQELEDAFRLARADEELSKRLSGADASARLLVYVVPSTWFLPDLPLHSLEEIRRVGGGHGTPEFDRDLYKVLFTQARLHGTEERGMEIVTNAFGKDPIMIVHVDLGSGSVVGHTEPPDHVVWGDIPTPMF